MENLFNLFKPNWKENILTEQCLRKLRSLTDMNVNYQHKSPDLTERALKPVMWRLNLLVQVPDVVFYGDGSPSHLDDSISCWRILYAVVSDLYVREGLILPFSATAHSADWIDLTCASGGKICYYLLFVSSLIVHPLLDPGMLIDKIHREWLIPGITAVIHFTHVTHILVTVDNYLKPFIPLRKMPFHC